MFTFGFWDSPIILAILLFLNGAGQASLWPNCVKSLSDWYDSGNLATIFGLWGTCMFTGGIIGTALAVRLQKLFSPDLRWVFVVPSLCVLFTAIIVFLFLKSPEEVNIKAQEAENELKSATVAPMPQQDTQREVGFFTVWSFQYVPELSFTMFGMKLVRYFLYMWLPMYLHQALKYPQEWAGYMSTSFEMGGVVGSACLGYFIDVALGGSTHLGVFWALLGSACSLVAFQITSTWGSTFNFVSLFMAGAFISGPDSLVSGALASEVGEKENAQSAVSGVINGFGGVGTIAEGPIVAFVVTRFGWEGSFDAMIVLTLLSVIAIGKAAIIHNRQSKHYQVKTPI